MIDLLSTPTRPAARPGLTAQIRRRGRSMIVAAVSLLLVLAAAAYVLAPSDASVRLSVSQVSGAQPYDHDVLPRYSLAAAEQPLRAKATETIYGKVDSKGIAVSDISLRIDGAETATREQSAFVVIGDLGTYRAVVHLRPGQYRLTLSLRIRGKITSIQADERLQDRHFYNVTAKVRPSGAVTFLPVTAY